MVYTARVYQCDRCQETTIQGANSVEDTAMGAQMVTLPGWLEGWQTVNDWLLCPSCAREWETTNEHFFRIKPIAKEAEKS